MVFLYWAHSNIQVLFHLISSAGLSFNQIFYLPRNLLQMAHLKIKKMRKTSYKKGDFPSLDKE
jgi:hypothetical protein